MKFRFIVVLMVFVAVFAFAAPAGAQEPVDSTVTPVPMPVLPAPDNPEIRPFYGQEIGHICGFNSWYRFQAPLVNLITGEDGRQILQVAQGDCVREIALAYVYQDFSLPVLPEALVSPEVLQPWRFVVFGPHIGLLDSLETRVCTIDNMFAVQIKDPNLGSVGGNGVNALLFVNYFQSDYGIAPCDPIELPGEL